MAVTAYNVDKAEIQVFAIMSLITLGIIIAAALCLHCCYFCSGVAAAKMDCLQKLRTSSEKRLKKPHQKILTSVVQPTEVRLFQHAGELNTGSL